MRENRDGGEKQRLIRESLKLPPVQEPPSDPITAHILEMYALADRCRGYFVGAKGVVPMPISTRDINDVIAAYGTPLPRELLDAAIFALDREQFDE